jgi:hypothetical protein
LLKPGYTLVYAVDHYSGLFRNDKGEVFDLRPNDEEIIKPSLKTFNDMDKKKL